MAFLTVGQKKKRLGYGIERNSNNIKDGKVVNNRSRYT